MTQAIVTQNLSKKFGARLAVSKLNWSVAQGSIHGLLGPNGAGKSTSFKLLLGLCKPTHGTAHLLGISSHSEKSRKGVVFIPEEKTLYEGMTVAQFLRYHSSFFPRWSSETSSRLTAQWKLPLTTPVERLSKGERARVLWTAALSSDAELLLADEPSEGMDPAAIENVLVELTQWASAAARTVVIATHRLDEVERICDSVSILHSGSMIISSDLDDLRSQWKSIECTGRFSHTTLHQWEGVESIAEEPWSTRVVVSSLAEKTAEKLRGMQSGDVRISDMNMREIYLAVVSARGKKNGVLETLV